MRALRKLKVRRKVCKIEALAISLRFNRKLVDNFNLLLLFIAAVMWPAEDWIIINTCGNRWIKHICMLGTGAAAAAKQRRHLGQIREHPYQRAGALSWIRRAQSQYCTRLREKVSFLETFHFLYTIPTIIIFVISIYPYLQSIRVHRQRYLSSIFFYIIFYFILYYIPVYIYYIYS